MSTTLPRRQAAVKHPNGTAAHSKTHTETRIPGSQPTQQHLRPPLRNVKPRNPIPRLDFHQRSVNLLVHGPLKAKAERWQAHDVELLDTLADFPLTSGPQNVWIMSSAQAGLSDGSRVHVLRQSSLSPDSTTSPSDNPKLRLQDAQLCTNVYASAEQEAKRSQDDKRAQHQKLKAFQAALKERVRQRSEMKKSAVDQISTYYIGVFLLLALLLLVNAKTWTNQERQVARHGSETKPIPKCLSAESLTLEDLPLDRHYFMYPEEKDKAQKFHRGHGVEHYEEDEHSLPPTLHNAETTLKIMYWPGYLDEIKKAQVIPSLVAQ